ncbi:hypothetical protein IE4803_PB00389 (plasmid) [Rhizobium etli bv. phaseoli str. IE4803]|nr:hypothetical protein IE4803_PB00389 [Rhizobium etli bv. phaseoli str. IE4803]
MSYRTTELVSDHHARRRAADPKSFVTSHCSAREPLQLWIKTLRAMPFWPTAPPEPMFFARDRNNRIRPDVMSPRMRLLQGIPVGDRLAELRLPLARGFVGDAGAACWRPHPLNLTVPRT